MIVVLREQKLHSTMPLPSMIIPFAIPQRQRPGVGVIAPMKPTLEGEMTRLAPAESKQMIRKHSAIPPESSKREESIPPCSDALYAIGEG